MTAEWIIANYENYIKDGCNNIEKDLLDLAKRQKAEIERLKESNKRLSGQMGSLIHHLETAKSEAYREFAERLKEISKEVTVPYVADTAIQEHKTGMFYYGKEDFDNLLIELTRNSHGKQ